MELDDLTERGLVDVAIGPGAPHHREEGVLFPRLRHARGDHLLGEDVERSARLRRAVEVARADAPYEGGGLDQLVEGEREDAALRHAVGPVARAPHALEQGRDRTGRADLHDQVDVADVDPELERRRRDEDAQRARLEALLGVVPARAPSRLPWWQATTSAPTRGARRAATRSAILRVLTKTRVVRCSRTRVAMRS